MKFHNFFIMIITAGILSGCGSVPPMNFSVPNVSMSTKKIDADLKSLTVTLARPDEKTGAIPPGTEENVPQLWHTALVEALNKMAIFQDDAARKVSLSVKVLKFQLRVVNLVVVDVDTEARYQIIDRKTGEIIFTKDISSFGTTPIEYAVSSLARTTESANRSVQNNITKFLQVLETTTFEKPTVPAKIGIEK